MPFVLALIYGFLAAAAALLLETLSGSFIPSFRLISFLLPALLEEGSKWIVFRQLRIHLEKSLVPSSPFFLGLLFGLGFSSIEVGLILWNTHLPPLFSLGGIVLVHIITSLFFAYYLFRLAPRTLFHTLFLIGLMTLFHASYNAFFVH